MCAAAAVAGGGGGGCCIRRCHGCCCSSVAGSSAPHYFAFSLSQHRGIKPTLTIANNGTHYVEIPPPDYWLLSGEGNCGVRTERSRARRRRRCLFM